MTDSPHSQYQTYRHPPIAEAVIEIRLDRTLAANDLNQASKRLKANYAVVSDEQNIDIQLDADNQRAAIQTQQTGYRLASIDQSELVMVRPSAFVCAKLAPYSGWEKLIGRARRDWAIWKKVVGTYQITRIGVRYINRIDVPMNDSEIVQIEDYLTIYPKFPEGIFPGMSNYAMQVNAGAGNDGYGILINSGSVISPIPGCSSFVLDLDLYRDIDIPQREDTLWGMIEEMREIKNRAFESLISEKTRGMFA